MSACSRAIPLWTPTVLKLFDGDSSAQPFIRGAPNSGEILVDHLSARCMRVSELRADCAVFWRDGWNRGLVRRCWITSNERGIESFVLCARKRRRVGRVRRSEHSEVPHAADRLHQEQQRSPPELRVLKQRGL